MNYEQLVSKRQEDFDDFCGQLELLLEESEKELSEQECVYSCNEDEYMKKLDALRSQNNYKVIFTYTHRERNRIMKKINEIKVQQNLETLSDVLVYLLSLLNDNK